MYNLTNVNSYVDYMFIDCMYITYRDYMIHIQIIII